MPKHKLHSYILFSLGMILVGSTVVIAKPLNESLPVFFVNGLRFLFTTIIFYLIIKYRGTHFPKLTRRNWIILFIQSFTGLFIFNLLLFYGLKYTSGVEAGVLLSLSPAFAAIVAYVLLKERINPKKWNGILLAVMGIIIVNSSRVEALETGMIEASIWGNLMILGVALSEGIFVATGKYSMDKLSPYQISFIISLIAFILFLPISLGEMQQIDLAIFDTDLILQIAYYTIFVGVIPYILVYTALKNISASTAATFGVFIPIAGIVLSMIFLGEQVGISFIIGATIAISGMLLTTKYD